MGERAMESLFATALRLSICILVAVEELSTHYQILKLESINRRSSGARKSTNLAAIWDTNNMSSQNHRRPRTSIVFGISSPVKQGRNTAPSKLPFSIPRTRLSNADCPEVNTLAS